MTAPVKNAPVKAPACDSAFDVAFHLLDRALEDGEYLQPQKLQRLLYLAQAYWAAAMRGQRLVPSIFLATRMGPLEPTLWRAFEEGRPNVARQKVPDKVKHFLDSLWRRFGAHSTDYLTRMTMSHPPFLEAAAAGARTEITIEAMIAYYGRKPEQAQADPDLKGAPAVEAVMRPRVMRSHKGRPVNVHAWTPKKRLGGDGEPER